MRYLACILLHLSSLFYLSAQTKTPFIFRLQEKIVNKSIHKYLHYDTLIETSGAKIHIHYSKDENKPYLLLLHGMGANARSNWYKQVGYLSKYFNLLMPDLIYFGESTSKENNYSVEFQAEQINQCLKKINIKEKINVMGFSYGGLTAAIYNQLFPSEINKLIIIDGPVKFYSSQIADSLASNVGVASIKNVIVPQTIKEFNAMQKAVLSRKMHITRKLKRKFIAYYLTPTLKSRQLQLNYITDNQTIYQNFNYNLQETPTLLIWGAKDGVVPLSVGENLHNHFPNTTKLIVFKKAKHDVHFRYSKKLNKAIVKFIIK